MKELVKQLLKTNPNIGLSIARWTLGLVIFPHGAQKLLGLFGVLNNTNGSSYRRGFLGDND